MYQSRFVFLSGRRVLVLLLGVLAAISSSIACRQAPSGPAKKEASADAWAVVDGREITRDQIDKAYRRTRDASPQPSEEEVLAAKLSILNDYIVQDILLAKATALKVEIPESELDTAYNNARKNISEEAYQKELTDRGLTAADMREGLRREMVTQKVLNQEISSKVTVSDTEITDFFNANRAQFNVAEEAYHLAQIVVTPVRDAQVGNRTGDDAATPEAAAAKVKMLMERLKGGASFRDMAVGYSEDPESAPRGGDLGFVPVSRLMQAPPALRNAVLNKEPGNVAVASQGGAHTLVLVVAHELAGQRDLSSPGVRDGITQTIRQRKEQVLRAAFLMAARDDARIENIFARRVVEGKGIVPSTPLVAPSKK